jgi:hypothetical protein
MSHDTVTEGTKGRATLAGTKPVDFQKPLDLSVLKDRVALVTGGVAGIGLGIVKALVQAGAWVAICDLNEEVGRKVEAELVGEGHKYVDAILSRLFVNGTLGVYRANAAVLLESNSSQPTLLLGNRSWQLSKRLSHGHLHVWIS